MIEGTNYPQDGAWADSNGETQAGVRFTCLAATCLLEKDSGLTLQSLHALLNDRYPGLKANLDIVFNPAYGPANKPIGHYVTGASERGAIAIAWASRYHALSIVKLTIRISVPVPGEQTFNSYEQRVKQWFATKRKRTRVETTVKGTSFGGRTTLLSMVMSYDPNEKRCQYDVTARGEYSQQAFSNIYFKTETGWIGWAKAGVAIANTIMEPGFIISNTWADILKLPRNGKTTSKEIVPPTIEDWLDEAAKTIASWVLNQPDPVETQVSVIELIEEAVAQEILKRTRRDSDTFQGHADFEFDLQSSRLRPTVI